MISLLLLYFLSLALASDISVKHAETVHRWGPATGAGPLGESYAVTFRSASYSERVLTKDTIFFRVYGGKARQLGGYWSMVPPNGGYGQSMDSALNPEWGNDASRVVTIRAPKGTVFFEGAVAPQNIGGGRVMRGSLLGGGHQIIIKHVDSSWVVADARSTRFAQELSLEKELLSDTMDEVDRMVQAAKRAQFNIGLAERRQQQ
jgi:hypothetical protein